MRRFTRSLQKNIRERIKKKFDEVSEEPFDYLEHFEGDYFKLRIGHFRALIDVDVKGKVLFVRVFDKRSRIYKR